MYFTHSKHEKYIKERELNLGKALKIALVKKGIKQKDFADTLNVSPQQISNWVSMGRISNNNQRVICKALEMKLSEFIALGE